MTILNLTTDELLTTTRAVRQRLDLERPVDLAPVRECLEIALQAPSGSNAQGWHFVVVTDPEKRRRLADLYRRSFESYRNSPASLHARAEQAGPDRRRQMERARDSSEYLALNLARVPLHLIPCIEGRVDAQTGPSANRKQASLFGSILPAVWSFMLAARSRGLGTAWTTLHLLYEAEAADVLGIPYRRVTQVALIPVAHSKGTAFRPARREPLESALHLEHW